ncbi:PREDICTED: uncharacterized protein LOC109582396 [Amphimedon queenslandica]|uniref:Uncharacterized protein n=1 Tax=Amphimedon queenslandica TaxID=400682 RepID=A0AAN0J7A7_AMPQE|nr:PREDICTED: uncharacterized protein LOC109582396 [Amphimedon queenslandica]|eukprot:XP_019852637.1 PREDICTED: uncharacterized protein LOC109582396 [Amphimedon queenslandica]
MQLVNPDQDLLATFDYSQKCLDSLAFFKQIDTSYQSISELYDKMNKYEEASTTALTYLLTFSYFVDDVDSLKGQIAQFKQSLMLDLYGSFSRENLQAVMTQVNTLIEEIQDVASSLFDKGDMCSPELRDLIKPQGDDLSSTHITFNFEVIVKKEDWKLEENAKFYIAMVFHIPPHGKRILKLEFCPSNIQPEYSVMSCGVAVNRSLHKLYYKYLLFPYYKTPVELMFIKKPQYEEASSCYRVLNISINTDIKEKDVFDSCIYPQIPNKEQGMISKFLHGASLELPPAIYNNLDFCADVHLQKEYDSIEKCEITDAVEVCKKILSVHHCLSKAIKANIKSTNYKEMPFYNSNASEVIRNQLECLLANVEERDHPLKILSGIVLCRCLMEISQNRLTSKIITRLLSTMAVKYDEAKSCYLEFDIVKSAVNISKFFTEFLQECILKAQSQSFACVLKVLPLYYWFCQEFNSCSFFQLDYDVDSLSQMIEGSDDKRIFHFSIKSSDFIDAITHLEPVQIQKDPLLQIQLVKASSELGHYSFLIKFVAFQIILVDLGVKLKSKEYRYQAKVKEITAVLSMLWDTKDNLK